MLRPDGRARAVPPCALCPTLSTDSVDGQCDEWHHSARALPTTRELSNRSGSIQTSLNRATEHQLVEDMKWINHLIGLRDGFRNSTQPLKASYFVTTAKPPDYVRPPADWSDIRGWDRYLAARINGEPLNVPTMLGAEGWEAVRFFNLVKSQGGRVWFPGCGVDPGPRFYAHFGFTVLVSDFLPFAVRVQQRFAELTPDQMFADWESYLKSRAPIEESGNFAVIEHDFTMGPPHGLFDVVVNCRAFQGLSPPAMRAAAKHFFAALRPGGAAIIDTMNVQGRARDMIEDSLIDAGFFIPFTAAERWYRNQLECTGSVYGMVLGRPHIPNCGQYRSEDFAKCAERDREILDSFRAEYEKRRTAEQPSVNATLARPDTIVAHVVYATG